MRWVVLAAIIGISTPVMATAGQSQSEPGKFSVGVGVGSHVNDGGDAEAVSFGFSPVPRLRFGVNVERNYVPTRVDRYQFGYSTTRGGTLTFVSGEIRYELGPFGRVSPFVLGGGGAGRSRLNVNEYYPDPITNDAQVMFAGGGVAVSLNRSLAITVDAKFMIIGENSETGAMLPIRAGLTWRF